MSRFQHIAVSALTGLFCLTGNAFAQNGDLTVSISQSSVPNAKQVQAKVLIDAPPSLVWNTITNYPQMQNILPGYEKSKVVKSSGASKLVDIAMKVTAFLPTYKYQVQVQESQPRYQITLNRVSGDFKALKATYRLIPQNNGAKTLLAYNLDIDPGFNLPGSQGILKSNTEKSLKALERHIEQEARKTVIGQR